MALIAVSGHPGCRYEEVARVTAQRLGFELLTQARIRAAMEEEFGAGTELPDKAFPSLVTSVLARLATEHHLVYCAIGGEVQARHFPGMLRVHVVAPENLRIGNLMLDQRLERAAARQTHARSGSRRIAATGRPSSARRAPRRICSTW